MAFLIAARQSVEVGNTVKLNYKSARDSLPKPTSSIAVVAFPLTLYCSTYGILLHFQDHVLITCSLH